MPRFSNRSKRRLGTCDERLQRVLNESIKYFDSTIIEGHRGMERQNALYDEGKSRVKYPNGKHNEWPSKAVDVAPYVGGGVSWDPRHCLYQAGIIMGIAAMMGITLRWGGDWDMDGEAMTDQRFQDLVHFEIAGG